MPHSLPANLGFCDFNSAAFTDNTTVLHPFVFSTKAFVIIYWPKYFGTEKSIFLWLKSAVVNRFWFSDFPPGPALYLLRRGDADSYPVEVDLWFSSNGLPSFHDYSPSEIWGTSIPQGRISSFSAFSNSTFKHRL